MRLNDQFWIPRIRLMFSAENPELFADRVQDAYLSRRNTEALLRYNLYVDCMPIEGLPEPDPVSMKRIATKATSTNSLIKDKG